GCGRALAAVRHAQHGFVAGADRRLAGFQGDMSGGGAGEEYGAGGAEKNRTEHCGLQVQARTSCGRLLGPRRQKFSVQAMPGGACDRPARTAPRAKVKMNSAKICWERTRGRSASANAPGSSAADEAAAQKMQQLFQWLEVSGRWPSGASALSPAP